MIIIAPKTNHPYQLSRFHQYHDGNDDIIVVVGGMNEKIEYFLSRFEYSKKVWFGTDEFTPGYGKHFDFVYMTNPAIVDHYNAGLPYKKFKLGFFPYDEKYIMKGFLKKDLDVTFLGGTDIESINTIANDIVNFKYRFIPDAESEEYMYLAHGKQPYSRPDYVLKSIRKSKVTIIPVSGNGRVPDAWLHMAAFNKSIILTTENKKAVAHWYDKIEYSHAENSVRDSLAELINNWLTTREIAEKAYAKAVSNYTTGHAVDMIVRDVEILSSTISRSYWS